MNSADIDKAIQQLELKWSIDNECNRYLNLIYKGKILSKVRFDID